MDGRPDRADLTLPGCNGRELNRKSIVKPVDVDRAQIEQVLLNLFVNAWQAMPGGGVLRISTENQELFEADVKPHGVAPGAYVKISVTDTGIGMDADVQKKVFDPFS